MFDKLVTHNNEVTDHNTILKTFLYENEYESDSFKFDIDEYIENENENNANILIAYVGRSEMLSIIKTIY